ncbi:MAG: hypothetical protein E7584_02135 [Ruminococcaceae bacterium]|nr:hypothetical protein [Oscillospiraceae bacterium]
MKRIPKVLILLLALCMIIPCMAACDNGKKDNNKNKGDGNRVTAPEGSDIEMPDVIDMDNYVYKAYVRDHAGTNPNAHDAQASYGNNDYRCIDFWVDAANSEDEVIPYAVYTRNQQIEDDYNCTIRQVASEGDQVNFLVLALQNGEGYDLTIITAKRAAQAATQGLLRNLKDNTYTDLSKPSFDQNAIQELSVQDKLYFVSGDMNISTLEVAGLSIVNMNFYEDLADSIVNDLYGGDRLYSNIYNIVTAKKWTMETLLTIAQKANIDIDTSDGALHVLPNGVNSNHEEVENKYKGGDTVGYHQYLYSTLWYFYGSGGRITTKGEDGLPELVVDDNKGADLYKYLFDKFNRIKNTPWIPQESSNILNMNFLTGKVLFADCSLFNIRTEIYPRATFEYGILPLPLYEEGMDYQSLVYFNNWAHLWAIPEAVGNQEYAERMMEIMAVYSSLPDSTMDAYYERTVYMLAAKANGSRDVIKMIRNSLVYDLALLYPSWGNIEYKLYQISNVNESEHTDITSNVATIEESIQKTVDLLLNPSGEE